jgi:isoleucyl-tRNA synthetase
MIEFKEFEKEIWEFWEKQKIYEKLMKRKGDRYFLLDGPPYANFIPHVGNIKNTVVKDMVIRLNFMKGKNVLFQPGFDTHGLPIENMVEKKLGLENKKSIEKFGITNFMHECKKNAALNKDIWMRVYKSLGSVYCLKEPYLTYENYYISSCWWAFSEMYKKGLVYEGEKPVMWCPKCETSLAGYEVTDSYKDLTDPGIYILFKLKESDENLLVYTTTPWTLAANVAIAIAPNENYVLVDINGKKVILGEKRLKKLSEIGFGYNVLKNFKGKELIGKKYEPILDIPLQKKLESGKLGKAHEIIASIPLLKERVASKIRAKKEVKEGGDLFEEFVTMEEGSGLVHTAPGHGNTDYIVGQHYKLACVSPVNEQGGLTEESGFSGFVKKADADIINKLESEGKLLYHEKITHSYPLCWRCKSPLIFRLSKQLFLKIDPVKKIILKENKKVNWLPEFSRERFENWVENAEDWNISRQRYWGVPIPIWRCECGKEKVIGSIKELEKNIDKEVKDLHSAEEIKIKCKCGKEMNKFKGIVDVWFDSGCAPFASMGYPEKNKKLFSENFPVSRINEAQDQIRGWFYSLMFCSAAVFEKAPYKEVSMVGWVLDQKGNKMSKSLGNTITGEQGLNELGADVLRYYSCWDVDPYDIQKFNIDIAKKEVGKIINVLWNLRNLCENKKIENLDIEDKWIISRLNNLIENYEKNIEKFELKVAMREISDFILNDFSRSYIQMSRDKEKEGVFTYCLVNLIKLLAPVTPFITEKIWQELKKKNIVKEESVHLTTWPSIDKKSIDNKLEKDFSVILEIIEKGLAKRDETKIGLKWPLSSAIIKTDQKINKEFYDIIKNQLNVKNIVVKPGKVIELELDTKLTPELEAEGYAREISRKIQAARKKTGLVKQDKIKLVLISEPELSDIFKKQRDLIKERTNSSEILFENVNNSDFKDKFSETIKGKKIDILFKKL